MNKGTLISIVLAIIAIILVLAGHMQPTSAADSRLVEDYTIRINSCEVTKVYDKASNKEFMIVYNGMRGAVAITQIIR